MLLAWPDSNTLWDVAGNAIVHFEDGVPVRLSNAERWAFGGSEGMGPLVIPRLAWIAPPDEDCDTNQLWVVGGLARLQ
jgi:hypothetical protein